MNANINYSSTNKGGAILPKIGLTINYKNRIVDNFEGLIQNTTNDHLTSLYSKNFYMMPFDSNNLTLTTIECPAMNNIWLNADTNKLMS
jgi:hypothetical protein